MLLSNSMFLAIYLDLLLIYYLLLSMINLINVKLVIFYLLFIQIKSLDSSLISPTRASCKSLAVSMVQTQHTSTNGNNCYHPQFADSAFFTSPLSLTGGSAPSSSRSPPAMMLKLVPSSFACLFGGGRWKGDLVPPFRPNS
jgi:hypothetical protein